MKRFFKHCFAIIGLAVSLSSVFILQVLNDGMIQVEDELNAAWVMLGVGVIGYFISGRMPKLGGTCMILCGLVIGGTFSPLSIIIVPCLLIAGILSFNPKKKSVAINQ